MVVMRTNTAESKKRLVEGKYHGAGQGVAEKV